MTLLRICLESAVLAMVVGAACLLFPRMRASHKAMLWWLVAAKLLIGLVPLPAVEVAALPAPAPVSAVAKVATAAAPIEVASGAELALPTTSDLGWGVTLWILGAAALLACAVPGWLRASEWRQSGQTIDDAAFALSLTRAARLVGLRREPRVLVVEGLPGPLVTGFIAPCVLLPADAIRRMRSDELEMTLAHELAHIARRDLWWGLVPALARRVFFFHPAAWIAEREYALAREAACDEAVLRPGSDAFAYGRLLVRFAARTPASASIPMSRHTMLRRRLEMIESAVRRVPLSRAGWALVAVAALALIPVRLVAKETRTSATPSLSASSQCLQIGKDTDTAYVITSGRTHTMCGDASDVRDAERARGDGGDILWFRVGHESWVIHDPETVARGRGYFSAITRIGQVQSEIGIEQSRVGVEQARIGVEQSKMAVEQAQRALREAGLVQQEQAAVSAEQQLNAMSADEKRRREMVEAELNAARAGQSADVDEQRERELAEEELRAARANQSADFDEQRRRKMVEEEQRAARTGQLPLSDADKKRLEEQMEVLSQRMRELGQHQGNLGEQQRQLGERMNRELAETQRALSDFLERSIKDGRAQRAN